MKAYDILGRGYFPVDRGDGGKVQGPCPHCGGNERFVLWLKESPDRGGRFACRQCGWFGDGIELVMELKGMGYREACEALGVEPKRYDKADYYPARYKTHKAESAAATPKPFEPREAVLPCETWRKHGAEFLDGLRGSLRTAAAYVLLKPRGLTVDAAECWGLAYNPADRYEPAELWGLKSEKKICIPAGLVLSTFAAADGLPISINIRRTDAAINRAAASFARKGIQRNPKDLRFQQITGSASVPTIFGEAGRPVIIVESYLDALLCWQEAPGLMTAVALNGAEKKPDAATMDLLKASPLVLLSLDYDNPGKGAMKEWRTRIFPSVKFWPSPDGTKDLGDMVRADILQWLVNGLRRYGYAPLKADTSGRCTSFCINWRTGSEWWRGRCAKRGIEVSHLQTPCDEAVVTEPQN
ncbi:MAG: toprim domain-containing protein [Deltaproteobacteria bacterium]|nr:toprim domain-containing protein [Deltaproteobacteria bacterium]